MRKYEFYVYITTSPRKNILYIGVTNNLPRRLQEHFENRGQPKTFAGKYHCYNLVFYEKKQYINDAIAREKQLKSWSRKKKDYFDKPEESKLAVPK